MDLERLRREAEHSPEALREYARQVFRREGAQGLLRFLKPDGDTLKSWFRAIAHCAATDPLYWRSAGIRTVYEDFVLPLEASPFDYSKRRNACAHLVFDGRRLCDLGTVPNVVPWGAKGARSGALQYATATFNVYDQPWLLRRRSARFCVFCLRGDWGKIPTMPDPMERRRRGKK